MDIMPCQRFTTEQPQSHHLHLELAETSIIATGPSEETNGEIPGSPRIQSVVWSLVVVLGLFSEEL